MSEARRPPPVVESIEVTNFRGLGEFKLALTEPLSVLIGRNGVGKSSVLQAASVVGALHSVAGRRSEEDVKVAIAERVGDYKDFAQKLEEGRVSLRLSRGDGAFASVSIRQRDGTDLNVSSRSGSADSGGSWNFRPDLGDFSSFAARYFRFEQRALVSESPAALGLPALEQDGRGLATLLSWIASNDRTALDDVVRYCGRIVPEVKDLRISTVAVTPKLDGYIRPDGSINLPPTVAGHRLEVVFESGSRPIVASQVSEGTLLSLATLVAALGPTKPKLLLLDDIDRGLHPKAQAELIACLRELLKERTDLQILCTTHSPYLLDELEEPEVRVLSRSGANVRVSRLAEHGEWLGLSTTMRPGEFWASVGDDWEKT